MSFIFNPLGKASGNVYAVPPIDRIISQFAGADVASERHATPVIVRIFRLVALGLMAADIILVLAGLGHWPELTLLSLGMIGLTWAMSNLSPFKTKPVDDNPFTRAGAMVRTLAAFGAPVVAAAVVNIPQISYRQGAGFLATLLGASAIMLALGKALDIKAALAPYGMCSHCRGCLRLACAAAQFGAAEFRA